MITDGNKFGFTDKESSINFDMTRNDLGMDPFDDGQSSCSMNPAPIGKKKKHDDGQESSRLSQSSARKSASGVKKKKKAPKEISDTASVKSTKSKTGGGTKKKKKSSKKDGDSSFDGDVSRISGGALEESKVEVPVVVERPKREFKPTEKVTLMDQGVDMLRQQLHVWGTNRKSNAFYSILYEYDYNGCG